MAKYMAKTKNPTDGREYSIFLDGWISCQESDEEVAEVKHGLKDATEDEKIDAALDIITRKFYEKMKVLDKKKKKK